MLSRYLSKLAGLSAAGLLAACAAWNQPINQPIIADAPRQEPAFGTGKIDSEGVFIGLAFSGGGTRASSFGHGMLRALQDATDAPNGLLPQVKMVTGVSGGSVTAAYFGLHGPSGVRAFREKYLIQNAEKYMNTQKFNPITLVKGISGGVNSRKTFARFLDESIFGGATFNDMWARDHATTWVNAADAANNTTFLFTQETFDALCSDLGKLPISEAVAASAAFPLVFSPIVLKAHQKNCDYSEPDWLTAARFNPEATSVMRAYGRTLESYRDPEKVQYVKLLDGGVTDNFGTTGLAMARAKAQTPFGPLSPQQAVKLKRMLFLVSNAATQGDFRWTKKVNGPGGINLGMAIANSAMASATRAGYDVLNLTLNQYAEDLVEWRCSLSLGEVRRLRGSTSGWDCKDLKLFVGEINFTQLDDAQQKRLNEVPTRLRLPVEQVDLVIEAGIEATKTNPEFNGFLRSLGVGPELADGFSGATRITPGATRITPSN